MRLCWHIYMYTYGCIRTHRKSGGVPRKSAIRTFAVPFTYTRHTTTEPGASEDVGRVAMVQYITHAAQPRASPASFSAVDMLSCRTSRSGLLAQAGALNILILVYHFGYFGRRPCRAEGLPRHVTSPPPARRRRSVYASSLRASFCVRKN